MARIVGSGSYLPRTVVDDSAFADDRFRLRGGSRERRHASEDETAIFMATAAALAALHDADVSGEEVDLIIGYSGMPDFLYPKDTNVLVRELGANRAAAWTLDTACASCISALVTADALISAGRHHTVLIVQTMSWVTRGIEREQTDYSSIGDGAAALVLKRSDEPGLLGVVERTDPRGFDFVQLRSPYATGAPEWIEFSSDPKYREYFGVTVLEVIRELYEETGLAGADFDWFIAHQVGPTLVSLWAKSVGIPPERVLHTYAETGNMSAANIPHIIDVARAGGRISAGDRALIFAPGAGMHLAALAWQF